VDEDLVRQAKRGDQEAFAVLARSNADWMFAVAQRILRDFDRAEDAVQQSLVIAWRELPTLRDADKFEAWIRRVLVRVCYVESRRARRMTRNLKLLPIPSDAAPNEEHNFALRDELERGFQRLPIEQKTILVLHHYLGLTPTEIAESLGIPAGTARSRLHYAHAAMRAALDAASRSSGRKADSA
jgi:RNA polymerase sigma-70 factor (ECF subfamily)